MERFITRRPYCKDGNEAALELWCIAISFLCRANWAPSMLLLQGHGPGRTPKSLQTMNPELQVTGPGTSAGLVNLENHLHIAMS